MQTSLILLVMIFTSITEIVSIGVVIPFLGVLTNPEIIYEHLYAQKFIDLLGISSPNELLAPVTVLFVEKGRILDVITKEKRGYNAIQVGFGKIKNSKLTKQMKGFFAKKST